MFRSLARRSPANRLRAHAGAECLGSLARPSIGNAELTGQGRQIARATPRSPRRLATYPNQRPLGSRTLSGDHLRHVGQGDRLRRARLDPGTTRLFDSVGELIYKFANKRVEADDPHYRTLARLNTLALNKLTDNQYRKVKEGDYPPPPPNLDDGRGAWAAARTFVAECFGSSVVYWKFYAIDALVSASSAASL